MSNLSFLVFRLAKFVFSVKIEVTTCVTFFKSAFVAKLYKSTLAFIFPPKFLSIDSFLAKYESRKVLTHFYSRSLLSNQLLKRLSHPLHLKFNLSPFI